MLCFSVGLFLSVTILAFCMRWYWQNSNVSQKWLQKYSGPPSFLFFGNAYHLHNVNTNLDLLSKLGQIYGSNYILWLGAVFWKQYVLLVSDLQLLEFVLKSQKILQKSFLYGFLHNWLGTGLLTSHGKKWKQRRHIITPTFHFKMLENYIDVFNSNSNLFVEKLKLQVGKRSFDVYPAVAKMTLDIICESAMGTITGVQNQPLSVYIDSVEELSAITIRRLFSLPKYVNFLYQFTWDYYKERKAIKIINKYTDWIINSRKNELSMNQSDAKRDSKGKKRLAFLDLLLQLTEDGAPLKHEDIREEVHTFMFEGYDTTASAIAFALYCLANNPDIQQNALDEVVSILGTDKSKYSTYSDLQKMIYLEMVIKETLRLYPSVAIFSRNVNEDVQYENETIPKGVALFLNIYNIQRDPKIYSEPEKFDPDRFLPENSVDRPPFAFVPFSAGPRNCIGQKFAMLELKSVISKILLNFVLLPAYPKHNCLLRLDLILKSDNGVCIAIRNRKL